MYQTYKTYLIRDWQKSDRMAAASVIKQVLAEYGLPWQPEEADQDVIEIESYYLEKKGEFWVIEQNKNFPKILGTAAYYPIYRGIKAVEIRKMYLLPEVRGKGLGKYLLQQLETTIQEKGFQEIWIETASVLKEAVQLYEKNGYLPSSGVETKRCDRIYVKKI
ncbi:GNAT family N-acetyltransferase [Aphanothece hegewaldii CCALA 016]|uniref:GNAT family N-acetyltransferase n=1 Tax=Aphanothece hegewaldii CCALA 016 TaxID=2107694 RepID=A0A2T1LZM5_9CHRO|nr:GNAT family N-acetyltransferase [Aphanothece hegewaldii]PSF37837.1 GNAT family N-acetyltransferase [Aphanothece hegewaldii CCALA 016]